MAEPPDDDGDIEAIIDSSAEPLRGVLGETERRRRSELAIALRPHAFPGERDQLLRAAEGEQAADWILEALRRLPIDTRYDTPQQVWLALGGHREVRASDVESESIGRADRRPEEPVEALAPPTRSVSAESGLWDRLVLVGLRTARLPFVFIERGAHAVLDLLPRP